MEKYQAFIEKLKFDDNGLIPGILQDYKTGEVLMFAWLNKESLLKTFETGRVTWWSRSRKKLWIKGESSGHTQELKEIFFDCDADCLLIKAEQNVAACHEGYRSCFFRQVVDGEEKIIATPVFDKDQVY